MPRSAHPDKQVRATWWYVATVNRGSLPCGNRAAYNRKEPAVKDSITYVAMDTHKKEHKVALIHPGDDEIVQFSIKNTLAETRKMVRKIKKVAPGRGSA